MKDNKHHNPKGVLVYFREAFLKEIDRTFSKNGIKDRATFIRLAAYNELVKLGNKNIPISYINPPFRSGAGADARTATRKSGKSRPQTRAVEVAKDSELWDWPYKGTVSAGKPDRFDSESTATVQASKRPKKGHVAVKINGQSMKPEFPHGSLVEVKLLKSDTAPKENKVYLWFIKSEGYVLKRVVANESRTKAKTPLHLVSDNPKFPGNTPPSKATLIGEVIGSL